MYEAQDRAIMISTWIVSFWRVHIVVHERDLNQLSRALPLTTEECRKHGKIELSCSEGKHRDTPATCSSRGRDHWSRNQNI
jgi:hypothetical protein